MLPVHEIQDQLNIPFGSIEDFRALVEDIRANGLLEDIVTYEDKVLDGRRRQQACAELEIEPRYVEWAGECGSPTVFVIAKNVSRRHLTVGERAVIAAKSLPLLKAEAAQRQKDSRARPGEKVGTKPQAPSKAPGKGGKGRAAAQAGKAAGVSARTVERAAKVQARGTAELQKAMQAGTVSVEKAAELATLTPEQQVEAVRQAESAPRREGFDEEKVWKQVARTVARLRRLCKLVKITPEEALERYPERPASR